MHSVAYRHLFRAMYRKQGFDRTRMYHNDDGTTDIRVPCHYCGVRATTEDHVPPLIWLAQMAKVEIDVPRELCVIVPACMECNCLIGDKVFSNIDERKTWVQNKLKKRYRQILSTTAVWTAEELSTMSITMQGYIRQGHIERSVIADRLVW